MDHSEKLCTIHLDDEDSFEAILVIGCVLMLSLYIGKLALGCCLKCARDVFPARWLWCFFWSQTCLDSQNGTSGFGPMNCKARDRRWSSCSSGDRLLPNTLGSVSPRHVSQVQSPTSCSPEWTGAQIQGIWDDFFDGMCEEEMDNLENAMEC